MNLIVFLLVAGVTIGVARAMMPILILAAISSLFWAVITRPLELLGFVTLLLMAEALSLRPLTTILCVAGLVALVVIWKPANHPSGRSDLSGSDST